MNSKIRQLQEEIRIEQNKIARCNHIYGKAVFNPETVSEPYGYKLVGQGSDTWSEPIGYHDVLKNRWTRVCGVCETEQHTYNQKPIVSGYEPSF